MDMNIKYHEYRKGNEYGVDHTLTNNWNPDLDHGDEYVKVYLILIHQHIITVMAGKQQKKERCGTKKQVALLVPWELWKIVDIR